MNYSVFTSHYFTDWILTATTLVSLVISWTHRAHKQLFLIQIYIIASLFIDVLLTLTELLFPDDKLWMKINSITLNLYSILEIVLISLFISNAIGRASIRGLIKKLCAIYILLFISIWLYFPATVTLNLRHLFAIEGILITTFSLFYFYEIMHMGFSVEINKDSNFIAISGILFYFSASVPYYFSSSQELKLPANFFVLYDCINYAFYT